MVEHIILGLVQGLTEFLPVSSSGHLAIMSYFFKINKNVLDLIIWLHAGTFLSLILFLFITWKESIEPIFTERKLLQYILYIVVVTIPIGIIGVFFKDYIDKLSTFPLFIAVMFGITGTILLFTFLKKKNDKSITFEIALIVGLAQVFALIPGISRSGITIAAALFLGVAHREAFYFSFIASLPAIGGAVFLELLEANFSILYLWGILAAFISGIVALYLLKLFVMKKKLWVFSLYLFPLSIILILYFYIISG